jgi:hypothetical protein
MDPTPWDLCNAGDKSFKDCKRLQITTAFLKVLSSSVLIHTNELIKYNTGSNGISVRLVHPVQSRRSNPSITDFSFSEKLKEYREQANRERFTLPESGNIDTIVYKINL